MRWLEPLAFYGALAAIMAVPVLVLRAVLRAHWRKVEEIHRTATVVRIRSHEIQRPKEFAGGEPRDTGVPLLAGKRTGLPNRDSIPEEPSQNGSDPNPRAMTRQQSVVRVLEGEWWR